MGNISGESFVLPSGYWYTFEKYLQPISELRPPFNLQLIDNPNDHGHALTLTWILSPDDEIVIKYNIYRSRNSELTEPLSIDSFNSVDTLIEAEENSTILIDSVPKGKNTFIDSSVPLNDVTYYYWIEAVSESGSSEKIASGYVTTVKSIPFEFKVSSPYPNPFNPSTTIQYEIPENSHVRLVIYDILGREVSVLTDTFVSAGTYESVWDGRNYRGETVGSGVYIFQLIAGSNKTHSKVMFLR